MLWLQLKVLHTFVMFNGQLMPKINACINLLNANPIKWSNTQTILRQKQTNRLSVFDHFLGLPLKGLTPLFWEKTVINFFYQCHQIKNNIRPAWKKWFSGVIFYLRFGRQARITTLDMSYQVSTTQNLTKSKYHVRMYKNLLKVFSRD